MFNMIPDVINQHYSLPLFYSPCVYITSSFIVDEHLKKETVCKPNVE